MSNLNMRTMSHDEVSTLIDHPAYGEAAHIEFCKRYLDGRLIEPASSAVKEELYDAAFDEGESEGQRCERELIIENIREMLCFSYKDKIEADVIDELQTSIRDRFPELPRKERKCTDNNN